MESRAAAAESAATRISVVCCRTYDCHRVRAGHPQSRRFNQQKDSERTRTGGGSRDCWGSSSGFKSKSKSARFVSSKKEQCEKHHRRSCNAEAESKNEHRVKRVWSNIDRLCVVKSPPGLSFERMMSPVTIRERPTPGTGQIPQASRSTTSRPGGPCRPSLSRTLRLRDSCSPNRALASFNHAAIPSLRCGSGYSTDPRRICLRRCRMLELARAVDAVVPLL